MMNQYKFKIEFYSKSQTILVRAKGLDTAWKKAVSLGVAYAKATNQTPTAIIFEGAN